MYDAGKGVIRKAKADDYREAVYMLTSIIPLGKTTTYGSIARILGISPRLVGRLLAENDNPIKVPCHRVIKSNGDIGEYTPGGKDVKKKLLALEGVIFSDHYKVSRESIIDIKEIVDP